MWCSMCYMCPGLQCFPLTRLLVLGLLITIILPRGALMAQPSGTNFEADEVIKVAPQQVKAGVAGKIRINLQFPEGYHLNSRAPLIYSVSVGGEGMTIAESDCTGQAIAPPLPLTIPFQAAAGTHQATA